MVSSVHCLCSPLCCNTSESHRPLVSCWKHLFLFHLVLCWLITDVCTVVFVLLWLFGSSWLFALGLWLYLICPLFLGWWWYGLMFPYSRMAHVAFHPPSLLGRLSLCFTFWYPFIPFGFPFFLEFYFVLSLLFLFLLVLESSWIPSSLLLTTCWFHA